MIFLRANGYPPAWHIDQSAYRDDSARWEIDVFSAPRQIDSTICVSTMWIADVARSAGKYAILEKEKPTKQVALRRCDDVFLNGGYFTNLTGNISDDELMRTVRAVRRFVRSNGTANEISGRFETEQLHTLLRQVDDTRVFFFEKSQDGTVSLSYIVRPIVPDLLAFRVTLHADGTSEIYVYRENGPDIFPAR
jgi:hypothetical protein